MTVTISAPGGELSLEDEQVLEEIQQRVLWLATRIVDAANHDRVSSDGLKVGGHQASSASLVTVMTALWFAHLDAADRVSVKPHASPVFHAIQYLLGNLDRSYLGRLREFGGLQPYPSRTKDPDGVDFSTGSVGLGAAAPLFAAATRRYVDAHFGPRPKSRFVALMGDAELDEGNIWEAVADPATAGLGDVTWIVDVNRQSLDRVVPGVRTTQWAAQFAAAGWQVIEVKYGRRLQRQFAQPGGASLRGWIDAMPNERYQSLFGLDSDALAERFLEGAPPEVIEALTGVEDLRSLVTDLGGHDLRSISDALRACDADETRPSVIFAYTVKGWGLPMAGDPRNHSALLTAEQIDDLRARHGLTAATEWDRIDPITAAGAWCEDRRRHLTRSQLPSAEPMRWPRETTAKTTGTTSTQQAFGRILVELARDPAVRRLLVTAAPDVATSTNLASLINRLGVFQPVGETSWEPASTVSWVQGPAGQHIELGISEMNLFLLLGQLGLAAELSDQRLLPVGTVYDPFVCRGLDALIYAAYSGARFVVAGTPSGVTLAPEGGAHQSTITPSLGLELPGVTSLEPAYASALDWLLCDALERVAQPDRHDGGPDEGGIYYLRLSTRPIDQAPFVAARQRLGDDALRRQVLAGAYRLVDIDPAGLPAVNLVASGAVLPEAVEAARVLTDEGIAAAVIDVTSQNRLYSAWQAALRMGVRTATCPRLPGTMTDTFIPGAPIVTVHDAASHSMAWFGSALGVPCVPLGVDSFGQAGSIHDLYGVHDLLPESIVNAALAALSLRSSRS